MNKLLKIFITSVIIFLVFIFCLIIALSNSYITTNYLLKAVNKTFAINIKAENLKISFLKSYISVNNFSVDGKDGNFTIDYSKNIFIKVDFLKLFEGKLVIKQVDINDSKISFFPGKKDDKLPIKKIISGKMLTGNTDIFSFFKCSINNINISNLSVVIRTRNNDLIEFEDANIFIPSINPDSTFNCRLTKFCRFIVNSDNFKLISKINTLDLTANLNKFLSPYALNNSISLENLDVKIKDKNYTIPKVSIKTGLNVKDNRFFLTKSEITEYSKDSNIESNINLSGDLQLSPFTFNTKINISSLSKKAAKIITSFFCRKNYQFSSLSFKGELKYTSNNICSSGIATIKDFNCDSIKEKLNKNLNSDFEYSFCYAPDNELLKINQFKLNLTSDGNTEILNAVLYNNIDIIASLKNFKIMSENFDFTINFNNFNLKNLKSFIPSDIFSTFKELSGLISANIDITGYQNNMINADIFTRINDLTLLTPNNINLKNINITDNTKITIKNFKKINIIHNKTSVNIKEEPLFVSSITGYYNIDKNKINLNLDFSNIYKNTVNILPFPSTLKAKINQYLASFDDCYLAMKSEVNFTIFKNPFIFKFLNFIIYQKNSPSIKFATNSPFEITKLENNNYKFSNNFKSIIVFNNFALHELSSILNKYGLVIDEGKLSGKLYLNFEKQLNNLDITGNINCQNLSGNFNNHNFKNIDTYQNLNICLLNSDIINFKEVYTEIKHDKKDVFKFTLFGTLSKNIQAYSLKLKNIYLNCSKTNKLIDDFLDKQFRIKTLDLTGALEVTKNEENKNINVKNTLSGNNLTLNTRSANIHQPVFSGEINSDIVYSKNNLKINNLDLFIKTKQEIWGSLKGSGLIRLPLAVENSNLNLILKNAKLEKIISFYTSFSHSLSIDLTGVDFEVDLTAYNLKYGKDIDFEFHTNISKNNDCYSIRPIIGVINGSDIFATFNYNKRIHANDSFDLYFKTSKLNIAPFMKLYKPSIYTASSGYINNLEISVSADNFSEKTINNKLSGEIKSTISNISFNDDITDFNILRILFVPFEVLSQINQFFIEFKIPGSFNDIMAYSDKVFSNQRKLKFSTGNIDIKVSDGNAIIEKLELQSGNNSYKSLIFTGTISLNEFINLYAYINLNNYTSLPIHITGKISSPNPNIIELTEFIKKTILFSISQNTFNKNTTKSNIINQKKFRHTGIHASGY